VKLSTLIVCLHLVGVSTNLRKEFGRKVKVNAAYSFKVGSIEAIHLIQNRIYVECLPTEENFDGYDILYVLRLFYPLVIIIK